MTGFAIEVLNGVVSTGDSVAYAVREGNLVAVRIGRVSGQSVRKARGRDVVKLRIAVTNPPGTGEVLIEKLERVVKLNPTNDDAFPVGTCELCGHRVRETVGGLLCTLPGDGYTSYCDVSGEGAHYVSA